MQLKATQLSLNFVEASVPLNQSQAFKFRAQRSRDFANRSKTLLNFAVNFRVTVIYCLQ
jgi:hypothetical protein